MPMRESSAYDPSSRNHIPPSLGPGAHRNDTNKRPQQTIQERVRALEEVRSYYRVNVTESSLDIDYKGQNVHRHYSLPFYNMPLGSTSQWLLYSGPQRSRISGISVIDLIRNTDLLIGRRPTQSEAEALAYYANKKTIWSWINGYGSTGVGCILAYIGRKEMKFPLRKPQPTEKYNNFPNRQFPILRGQLARAMWHLTRTSIYALGCSMLSSTVIMGFFVYPAIVFGMSRDTRTKDVTTQLRNSRSLGRATAGLPTGGLGLPETGEIAANQEAEYGHADSADYYVDTEANVGNDYSRGQTYAEATPGDTSFTDGSTMDDNAMRQHQQGVTSRPIPDTRKPWSRKPSLQPEQRSESSPQAASSDDFFSGDSATSSHLYREDHASPTAGADPIPPIRASDDGRGGGSAWDRVRHNTDKTDNGTSQPVQSRSQRRRPNPESAAQQQQGESFSFSQSDTDQQLARASAQREFDEMLERERKG